MDKRCPKCGEKMRFTYSYEPGKYASGRYFCPTCSSKRKFIKRLISNGYSFDGRREDGAD